MGGTGYAESPSVSPEQWEEYMRFMGMDEAQTPQVRCWSNQLVVKAFAPGVLPVVRRFPGVLL